MTIMDRNIRGLALKRKKPVVGFGVSLGSVRIVEMAALTRFDYIMVDLLHSHFGKEGATDAIRSIAQAGGPIPLGRVASNDAGSINELLDAGASGIIVPMVGSEDEAVVAVEAAYYPPLGKRSKGSPAAVFYGSDYYSKINELINLIVMIETPEAAEKAGEILSVPGVTGCLIGAGDLHFIMQKTGNSSALRKVVQGLVETGGKAGKAMGISVNSPEDLKNWWDKGIDFFLASHDMAVFNAGIRQHERDYLDIMVSERA